MSMDMNVFAGSVDDSLVPQWLAKFKELGMLCEIHPDFSFSDQVGFLPFKLSLKSPSHVGWENKSFLTGFEFSMYDFDLETELRKINPTPSIFQKLFNKRVYQPFASELVDKRLSTCKKMINFRWSNADHFELRMATVSAAILAEITDGVCNATYDGAWYDNDGLSKKMANEANDYEASLKPREFRLHEFESW